VGAMLNQLFPLRLIFMKSLKKFEKVMTKCFDCAIIVLAVKLKHFKGEKQ
jgi:hypothetical protein